MPDPIRAADVTLLAAASHGLTGADLNAVVEDAKLLYAHDKARGKPIRPVEEYFLDAIETVQSNRRNYRKRRPALFQEAAKIGFDVENGK